MKNNQLAIAILIISTLTSIFVINEYTKNRKQTKLLLRLVAASKASTPDLLYDDESLPYSLAKAWGTNSAPYNKIKSCDFISGKS